MGGKKERKWTVEPTSLQVDISWGNIWIFRLSVNRDEDGIYTWYVYTNSQKIYPTPQQLGVGLVLLADEYEKFVKNIMRINSEHAMKLYNQYVEKENL